MNRLLGRMGQDQNKPQASTQKHPEKAPLQPTPAPVKEEPVKLLSAEEYKPSKEAPEKSVNLDAMRELANANNRAALKSSKSQKTKAIAFTNFGITGVGFALGSYLMINATGVLNSDFGLGVVTIGLSIGIGLLGLKSVAQLNQPKKA